MPPLLLNRRQLLQYALASGALAGVQSKTMAHALMHTPSYNAKPTELTGTEFILNIHQKIIHIQGQLHKAIVVNDSFIAPTLRFTEGDEVTIHVNNHLNTSTSIHWHGILLPSAMDGVPGMSFSGIGAGETFTYRFIAKQSGTYWYHSHSGFQQQVGLNGAIVIQPKAGEAIKTERDYVVMLGDWTDLSAERIFAILKKHSDFFNVNQPTMRDFLRDVKEKGLSTALDERKMWQIMRMSQRDLSDVSGAAYTYLMNGLTSDENWTGLFQLGERVRLRFINASANSYFDVRIAGLMLQVVAADGQAVQPVSVEEFRIAAGETFDVVATPDKQQAYTIFAQSMDRTGFVRGTLTPDANKQALIPAMDNVESLTMQDMMGSSSHHANMHMHHGVMAHHAKTELRNSGVDMLVDMPNTRLDDRGVGLRNSPRKVLTYADLHTVGGALFDEPITRDIELHLTGNMQRFVWSFNGVPYEKAKPIQLAKNEHVRFILHNDTMMNHPIHLHGMWSEIENQHGEFQCRKHTVNIQPAQRIHCRVKANAVGRWAFHCHLLYHMHAGMFREVVVS